MLIIFITNDNYNILHLIIIIIRLNISHIIWLNTVHIIVIIIIIDDYHIIIYIVMHNIVLIHIIRYCRWLWLWWWYISLSINGRGVPKLWNTQWGRYTTPHVYHYIPQLEFPEDR